MENSEKYNIFEHPDLFEKEEEIDDAIRFVELDNNINAERNVKNAIKSHSRKLIDIIIDHVYDPEDVSVDKYIEILKKYTRAFELVKNPRYSIDIEMETKRNIHRIWKDLPHIIEKLPEEIERIGLFYDYPSDLIMKYEEIKDKIPQSLTNNQIINLERTYSGSFYVYLDYFLNLELQLEDYKEPDFIIRDTEKICDDAVKFGKIINAMNESLKYVSQNEKETLEFRMRCVIKEAIENRLDFIDEIPIKLNEIIDEQIMSIVKSNSKILDEIIYKIPDTYKNHCFLSYIEKALSEDRLINKNFFYWLLNRTGYKK